jgi:hypothetical protein
LPNNYLEFGCNLIINIGIFGICSLHEIGKVHGKVDTDKEGDFFRDFSS